MVKRWQVLFLKAAVPSQEWMRSHNTARVGTADPWRKETERMRCGFMCGTSSDNGRI
jgi:hypothetical protein